MKMNDDPKWLKRMTDLEDGCDVSVGGMAHARSLKQLCTPGTPPPEACSQCHGTGEVLPTGPSDAPVEFCDACMVGLRAENEWWKVRLAMKDEALKAAEKFIDYVDQKIPLGIERSEECVAVSVQIENALSAAAPAVAAFLQRVEDRGAAKELRAITDRHKREIVDQDGLVHEVVASAVLYARAAELEGR